MYNFHPAHILDVRDHDVGDAKGDAFFMCEDFLTGQRNSSDPYNSWITQWRVELVPLWGQYQNCRGYPPACSGPPDSTLVGHEAALGLGTGPRGAGQCTVNSETGEWWSLPSRGMCAPGQTVGAGCTWCATAVKTIDGGCLIHQRVFYALCEKDGRAPWPAASAAFLAAFAADSAADGGCPPVG